MTPGKYTNTTQQRLLLVIEILARDVTTGYAPGQIANQLGVQAPVITRDLDNLLSAGWVIYSEKTGRWMLAGKAGQIGIMVMDSLGRAAQQLEEAKKRFITK
jgi:DNA-binding IclR family transcriptional regulator